MRLPGKEKLTPTPPNPETRKHHPSGFVPLHDTLYAAIQGIYHVNVIAFLSAVDSNIKVGLKTNSMKSTFQWLSWIYCGNVEIFQKLSDHGSVGGKLEAEISFTYFKNSLVDFHCGDLCT